LQQLSTDKTIGDDISDPYARRADELAHLSQRTLSYHQPETRTRVQ
jgi:hypothetical protein